MAPGSAGGILGCEMIDPAHTRRQQPVYRYYSRRGAIEGLGSGRRAFAPFPTPRRSPPGPELAPVPRSAAFEPPCTPTVILAVGGVLPRGLEASRPGAYNQRWPANPQPII